MSKYDPTLVDQCAEIYERYYCHAQSQGQPRLTAAIRGTEAVLDLLANQDVELAVIQEMYERITGFTDGEKEFTNRVLLDFVAALKRKLLGVKEE